MPYKTLAFSKIEGRHGTYALIDKGENRDRKIRKPRPSIPVSYTHLDVYKRQSEDSDLVATENNYAAKENELQQQIDNIESTHPGYDEYRYDLDSIGHNPHELASYLTAL